MVGFYIPDFLLILPEIVLVFSALGILMGGVFWKGSSIVVSNRINQAALLSFLIALGGVVLQHKAGEVWVTFEGQIIQDDFIYFAKVLILSGSAGAFAISLWSLTKDHIFSFEYSSLILLATLGMVLMVESNDLMSLFVGLEIQGLALYVLAALNRDRLTSSEAALKYFVLGALATALYLYGASLIYGFTGATNFEVIASIIHIESQTGLPLGLTVGLIFIMGALAFKVSAVPFHMWTPDVYQGCSTSITAFIAAAPKVAAMIVFLRLMVSPFMVLYEQWQAFTLVLSFGSMVLGAFSALRQTDLKRLLAYSAVGQTGYILLGVAAGNDEGIQAILVYLLIYLVTIIGTFGCFLCLRGKAQDEVQSIEDLSGISIAHPKIAFILAVFMFSLAGIPPLAGFFAKFYIFKAAISAGLFGLAIVGVLTSVIAAYYYLKIVKVMYFDSIPAMPSVSYGQTVVSSFGMTIVLNLCALIILGFCIFPNPVIEMAQQAALTFQI